LNADVDRDRRSMARRSRASRARAAFLHTHISAMSALLASSFVGRVAAFKATKIQVRIFSSARATRGRAARRGGVARRGCVSGADAYRISRARAWARVGARGRADGRAGGGETSEWECFASFAGAAGAAGAARARGGVDTRARWMRGYDTVFGEIFPGATDRPIG